MNPDTSSFPHLFRKYRLKSEFATLTELGNALAEKGFSYEDSIFSHWQKGTRIPQNRVMLLRLLQIFAEHNALTTVEEANEFMTAAGQGCLSQEELAPLRLHSHSPIFQVPNEISNFSGRQDILDQVEQDQHIAGKVMLLYGPAGVGKTAIAIQLGHLLRNRFPEGILWYKVEENNLPDILLSIAHVFGEDISEIKSTPVRATVVRALLAHKQVLLFLDSAELCDSVHLLLPNSDRCTTILTSQNSHLKVHHIPIPVQPFSDREVILLFQNVLKKHYPRQSTGVLLKIAQRVGNLPLPLHILAQQLFHANISLSQLPTLLTQEKSLFRDLPYEEKNLDIAIAMSYDKLPSQEQSVLVSASIFQGKDFSSESIGYINGLSTTETTRILHHLVSLSLLEHSTKTRYRIHPAIQAFVRDKLNYPRSSSLTVVAVTFFLIYSLYWITIAVFVNKADMSYEFFSNTYGVMALFGGICGLQTALRWGGIKTSLGKSLLMFSIGLFLQEFGQLVYAYYLHYTHIVPYPSLGDVGYFGCIPFYTYGVWLLAQSSGIKISMQSFKKKIIALVIPLGMVTISYFLYLQNYHFEGNHVIKIFLDFGYPLGDSIYVSLSIVVFILSRTILDGIMRSRAFLLLIALFAQYLGDFIFSWTSQSFYSGNYVDYICFVAYFIMTIALLQLRSLQIKVREK